MNIKFIVKRVLLKAKKYSPQILTATATVGMIGSTVLACKATLSAGQIIEEAKSDFAKIEEAKKIAPEKYGEEDILKDRVIVTVQTTVKFVKLYGPSVSLGLVSLALFFMSNRILENRNIQMGIMLTGLKEAFDAYRGRIIEKYGELADEDARYLLSKDKIEEIAINPETGKEKKVKRPISRINKLGIFEVMFDKNSSQYNRNRVMDHAFLKGAESFCNNKLRADGYLYLHDVYDYLGVYDTVSPELKKQRLAEGHMYGWIYDAGNPNFANEVCFNIKEHLYPKERQFENLEDTTVLDEHFYLLTFQPDGIILDLI